MSKRKKIALIFATGTVLSSLKNRTIVFVDDEGDVPRWLEQMPELGLIAEIEPRYFLSESETFGYGDTMKLSELINSLQTSVDGIVILMRTENIISQAVLLNFLHPNIDLPIIFTGSVVSPQALAEGALSDLSRKNTTLSLKSNLINAVQVATRDWQGFGIMYGNRLIEPSHAVREDIEALNVFASADGKYAGKVEFGISLSKPRKISNSGNAHQSFSTAVQIIDSRFLTEKFLNDFSGDGLIIKLRENEQLPVAIQQSLQSLKKPVILYNYWYVLEHGSLLTISRITEESLLAKVMWLVGEKKPGLFKQKIKENLIGEILS